MPALKRGQVLVKILYSGICRAQYNEMIGLKGPDKFLPHMLGHEASAIVEAVGAGVTKVRKGDHVILSWIKSNGLDGLNTKYRNGGRVINAGAVTTFSEHSVVSENRVTKIPKSIPPDVAAIIGCAIATGGGIVLNTLNLQKGQSIAIFGVGGIGSSAIQAAKLRKAAKIIAIDVHDKKLTFAKKLGATHGVNAEKKDVLAEIKRISKDGVDCAIDASGVKSAMETGFAALKYPGTLVIAGNLPKGQTISFHPFELIKGKRIVGSWGGETLPSRDFPKYVKAYINKQWPIEQLITHRLRLPQINTAFKILKSGDCGRILIKM